MTARSIGSAIAPLAMKLADVAQVAHRAGRGARPVPKRGLDGSLENRAPEPSRDLCPEDREDPVAKEVEHGLKAQHHGNEHRERHESVDAATRDHPVIDLDCVERQREVQHVDEEADQAGRAGAAGKVPQRRAELGRGSGDRPCSGVPHQLRWPAPRATSRWKRSA